MRGLGNTGDTGRTNQGARPELPPEERPVRKRGVYRAAKRGEKWAVKVTSATGWDAALEWCYYRVDWAKEFSRPSFMAKVTEQNNFAWTCTVPLSLWEEATKEN